MCCIGTILATLISHLLYFSEKFLYCFTCAALISCLVTTIFVTLGMGIGIGYNYCYVDYKTKHRYVPAKYFKYNPTPHWKRSAPTDVTVSGVTVNENNLRTNGSNQTQAKNEHETKFYNNTNNIDENRSTIEESDHNISYGITEQMSDKNQVTEASTENITDDSPKMIIPISGLDLIALLSKLRSENRNYSLQIVTT